MSFTYFQLFAVPLLSSIVFLLVRGRQRQRLPFPPGPKGLPLIGNLRDVPKVAQWLTYEKWGQVFGSDILHLKLFGMHLVVLNSEKASNDLLDKRSSIYSDRPQLVALTELLGMGSWAIGVFPYGNKWRTWEKAFYSHLQQSAVHRYHPNEVKATRQLLYNLLDTPQDFLKHIHHMMGHNSLSIAYGIDVAPRDDPNLARTEEAFQGLNASQKRGLLFNFLPFYIHLPWWFPGAGFKKEAETYKHRLDQSRETLHEAAKKALEENRADSSISASMIADLSEKSTPEAILMARGLPYNIYSAGIDTTTAAVQSFVLAMVLYPDVQKRAQEEIDSVLGHGHLPKFGDEHALPYVKAMLHEVLRWSPPTPLGVPHRLTEDDVYNGYFIPAGSMVFYNSWAILHNSETYPEPLKFKPERFLDPTSRPPFPEAGFGFGRRKCPGRHLALEAVWITIASMVAAFDFLPETDADGRPAPPVPEFIILVA
ncbi:CyP450 monooxygenase [Lactarius quietus]|nr:CyP450 monooxygenase [Lactarius quietus]